MRGKVGKGREEGAWLQHLGLALVGRAHAVQRGPFPSSPHRCHLNAAGPLCIMHGQHVRGILTQDEDQRQPTPLIHTVCEA